MTKFLALSAFANIPGGWALAVESKLEQLLDRRDTLFTPLIKEIVLKRPDRTEQAVAGAEGGTEDRPEIHPNHLAKNREDPRRLSRFRSSCCRNLFLLL